MSRANTLRLLFAILATCFFAAPIALRVAGVTAEQFENRRLADPPRVGQGWEAFQQTSRYLTDHMPLRADAVRLNTRIWTDLFGTDPRYTGQTALADDQALPFAGDIERDPLAERRPQVNTRSGRGGWLYLNLEFSTMCTGSVTDGQVVRRWADLVERIRAEGHKAAMFVAPNKSSVYPEHLPEKYPYDRCAPRRKEQFWRAIDREGPALGVFGLRDDLLRLKQDTEQDLFQRQDYHWTTLGATTLVDGVLDFIGGDVRLERGDIVSRGAVSYTGDLSVVGGRSSADQRIEYDIVRPADAPRIPGRTLLVCDSFAYRWMRLFKPYFESVRYVSVRDDEKKIVDEIRDSDTVIVVANELLVKAQAERGEQVTELLRTFDRQAP